MSWDEWICAWAPQKEYLRSPEPSVPLDVSPIGFHSQTFLISLWCMSWRLGCSMWGTKPSLLREKPHTYEISPYCVLPCQVWDFLVRLRVFLSYPSCCGSFIYCCGGSCSFSFQFFLSEIISHVAVDFRCHRKMNSGSSYIAILDPRIYLFVCYPNDFFFPD